MFITCSIENGSLITQVDHSDKSESPQNELVKVPQSEGNVAANADSEGDQSKQEIMMVPEGHLNPTAPIAPNYGFGIMPPVQGGHLIQFDGHETQAQDVSRVSTFVVSLNSFFSLSFLCQAFIVFYLLLSVVILINFSLFTIVSFFQAQFNFLTG